MALTVRQRILLHAHALQEQRRRLGIRDRIQQLRLRPNELSEDDLEAWKDIDKRLLHGLFIDRPWIREQFTEYMDTPLMQIGSLFQFTRRAWRHAGIGSDHFDWNWHHLLMCGAYEDFYEGKIPRLILNVPPATTKSILSGVMFEAWAWAKDPTASFMYTSYSNEIPVKMTGHLATLVKSRWYQKRWGRNFQMTKEGERELRNSRGGWHLARGVLGGGTGQHPRFIFMDDPQKGMYTSSEKKMGEAVRYFSNTLATRGILNDARIAIIMQRLAINDLCGAIFGEMGGEDIDELDDADLADANDELKIVLNEVSLDWHHICLPMQFDPDHPYRYPLDPRTEKGELLWPERLPLLRILRLKRELQLAGEPNVEAQLDQNPRLSSQYTFGDITIGRIAASELPHLIRQGLAVRAWDRAATQGGGDWTAGVLMALYQGIYYILDVQRRQLSATERDNFIESVAISDSRKFDRYRVTNEIGIGPDAGSAQIELAKRLDKHKIDCTPSKTGGKDKVMRALPLAGAYKNGLVRHLDGRKWTGKFESEFSKFPDGANDDQVDAAVYAHRSLRDWVEETPK